MPTQYLEPAMARELGKQVYPDYNGAKFRLEIRDGSTNPINLNSYWDSGSRDYYRVVRLADMGIMEVPQNGTPFDGLNFGAEKLPAPGFMVVEHSISCGKDVGLTFHVHPDNSAKFITAPAVELPWSHQVVLVATRGLKSSYAGISNYRFHEAHKDTGITSAEWESAKSELIATGMLNAAGAVTIKGKNAVSGQWDLYRLKRATA